ncbi:alanine racemase [Fundicoccus ignavus]|uniref:Alanine racemase n=1 Tax=Fundicoccus ignavus TaxID=2664442 RepID=A0A844BZ95_9LACT|nr:alanine racemase [Fundicoccus ignavus]MRJ47378.1 alanine racemase [Fundicoccus ignavus]
MFEPSEHRPTEAIVDLNAIQHNVRVMLEQMDDEQKLYAVIKADGYGHGAVQVAEAALAAGAKGLAVSTVDEAIELRQSGHRFVPILVLGLTDPRGIAEIIYYNLTITVSGLDFFAKAYQQLEDTHHLAILEDAKLRFHLKLDTGMGRIGLTSAAEVAEFAKAVEDFNWVDWEGVFTHFSTAGGGPESYIDYQWNNWLELTTAVPESVRLRHYANSAMGLWYPREPKSDIVRYGIALYGVDPKDQLPSATKSPLKPAMSIVSEIVHVKHVPAGTHISYGATYEAADDQWIATVPIGYADGWLRRFNEIPVLVDGNACPIVGTINMDQLMIQLPQEYPVGTTVTLLGQDGQLENHVSMIAASTDTIGYEILCGIGKRVPRIYLTDDI